MLNILIGVLMIAALLNGFVFGGSVLWSLPIAAIALVLLGFRLIVAKKTSAVICNIVSVVALLVLMVAGMLSGMGAAEKGYLSYDASMAKINSLLGESEFFKAGEELDELEKDYGMNDRMLLLKARSAIGLKDFAKARSCIDSVSNKKSDQYYIVLGRFYDLQRKYKELQTTYIEAAKIHPLWSKAQLIAGTQSTVNKDYSIAEYFLLRAAEQDRVDPTPLYYLGVIRYERGSFKEAEEYFSESLKLGLKDEFAGYVSWYRQKMGGGK